MTLAAEKSAVSLSKLADRCGVSQSTVSRVLNNTSHGRFSVSTKVRDRILRVAKELNYRPSIAARNLAVGKTRLIALLGVAGLGSDRAGPVEHAVATMARVLDDAGYEICMQVLSRRHSPYDPPPLRVDAVVATGARTPEEIDRLESTGIPYLSLNGICGASGDSVQPDDRGGAILGLKHLVELGHKKIAYIDIEQTHSFVLERREGFLAASREFGFDVPKFPLPPADSSWDPFYEPFIEQAILKGRATAVLAYTHYAALQLMRKAQDMGLRVPDDFSIVCFNDEPITRLVVPSLTVIDLQPEELGRAAAELVLRRVNGSPDEKLKPMRIRVPQKLSIRESSAKPGGHHQKNTQGKKQQIVVT